MTDPGELPPNFDRPEGYGPDPNEPVEPVYADEDGFGPSIYEASVDSPALVDVHQDARGSWHVGPFVDGDEYSGPPAADSSQSVARHAAVDTSKSRPGGRHRAEHNDTDEDNVAPQRPLSPAIVSIPTSMGFDVANSTPLAGQRGRGAHRADKTPDPDEVRQLPALDLGGPEDSQEQTGTPVQAPNQPMMPQDNNEQVPAFVPLSSVPRRSPAPIVPPSPASAAPAPAVLPPVFPPIPSAAAAPTAPVAAPPLPAPASRAPQPTAPLFPPSPAPRSGALPSPRIPAGRNGSVLPPPTYRAAPAAAPDRSWLRFVPGTLEQRDAFRAWRRDGAPEAWSAGQDAVDELRRARDVYEERISLDALRGAIGFLRHIPGTPQRAAFLEARDSMRPVLGSALTLGVPRTDVQHLEDSRKEARETAEQSYRREISQTGAPFEPDILQRRIETAVEYAELRSPREAAEERAEYADRVRAQRRLENVPKRVLVTLGNLATRNAFMRLVTRSSASSMISVRGAGNTVATQRIIRREERRADRVRRHAEQRGFPERTASGVADFAAALAASGRTTRPVAQAEAAAPMSQALATRAARLIMNRLAQRDSNGQLIHATQTPVFEAVTGELGISRSEWADVEDMMQRLAAADAAAAAARAARFAARGSGQGGSTGGGAPQAQRSGYTGRPQTGQTGSPQVGGGQQGNASPQRGNRQGQGGGAGGSTGRSSGQSGGRQQGGSGGRGGQQTGRQGGGRASGTGGAGQGRAGGPPPRRQPSQQQPRQQP